MLITAADKSCACVCARVTAGGSCCGNDAFCISLWSSGTLLDAFARTKRVETKKCWHNTFFFFLKGGGRGGYFVCKAHPSAGKVQHDEASETAAVAQCLPPRQHAPSLVLQISKPPAAKMFCAMTVIRITKNLQRHNNKPARRENRDPS